MLSLHNIIDAHRSGLSVKHLGQALSEDAFLRALREENNSKSNVESLDIAELESLLLVAEDRYEYALRILYADNACGFFGKMKKRYHDEIELGASAISHSIEIVSARLSSLRIIRSDATDETVAA